MSIDLASKEYVEKYDPEGKPYYPYKYSRTGDWGKDITHAYKYESTGD